MIADRRDGPRRVEGVPLLTQGCVPGFIQVYLIKISVIGKWPPPGGTAGERGEGMAVTGTEAYEAIRAHHRALGEGLADQDADLAELVSRMHHSLDQASGASERGRA
jgi:hypothetical protein